MTAPLDTSDTSRRTFVEEGSAFHGTFDSTCPIVVSGSIHGNVTAPEVTIAPLGVIDGTIKADKLTSAGTLSGTVDAVHVLLSGRVRGDTVIRTEQLDANLHAARGRLELTFGPRTLEVVQEADAVAAEADGVAEEADAVAAEADSVAGADAVAAGADAMAGADAVAEAGSGAAHTDTADTEAPDSDADDADEASIADFDPDAGLSASGEPGVAEKNKAAGRRERRARKKLSRG